MAQRLGRRVLLTAGVMGVGVGVCGGGLANTESGFSLAGTLWAEIGRDYGIDPVLMYAIALVESGRGSGAGLYRPWPFAIGTREGGYFPPTRGEAEAQLQALGDLTWVDIGHMQVNYGVHHHRVAEAASLLEPRTNIVTGGAILREALDSAPEDLELAVGRYHSWRQERSRYYGRIVLGVYANLQRLSS